MEPPTQVSRGRWGWGFGVSLRCRRGHLHGSCPIQRSSSHFGFVSGLRRVTFDERCPIVLVAGVESMPCCHIHLCWIVASIRGRGAMTV